MGVVLGTDLRVVKKTNPETTKQTKTKTKTILLYIQIPINRTSGLCYGIRKSGNRKIKNPSIPIYVLLFVWMRICTIYYIYPCNRRGPWDRSARSLLLCICNHVCLHGRREEVCSVRVHCLLPLTYWQQQHQSWEGPFKGFFHKQRLRLRVFYNSS